MTVYQQFQFETKGFANQGGKSTKHLMTFLIFAVIQMIKKPCQEQDYLIRKKYT